MSKKSISLCCSFLLCLFFISPSFAKSNDPYGDIYITKNWGDLSNCGPIAALMVSKFAQVKTPSKSLRSNIRKVRRSVQRNIESNRWWKMSDIKSYFSKKNIQYTSERFDRTDRVESKRIKSHLDSGSVVVVNVNMNNLSRGSKIGKPYFTFPIPGGWGHFLVVVGYKYVNDQLVYEVHDSYIKNGKNRSYYAENIDSAIKKYNPQIVVIPNTRSELVRSKVNSFKPKTVATVSPFIFDVGIDNLSDELLVFKEHSFFIETAFAKAEKLELVAALN